MALLESGAAWLAVGLLLALLFLVLGFRLRGALWTRAQRRRQRRARAGERDAPALLEGLGYRVVESQPTCRFALRVDDAPVVVELRADFLVERRGRRFVAEVKTGRNAPLVHTPATRRQLLEYRLAYDVSGALLVDMERRHVQRVEFPRLPQPSSGKWIAVTALLAAVTVWLLWQW